MADPNCNPEESSSNLSVLYVTKTLNILAFGLLYHIIHTKDKWNTFMNL